MSICSPFEVEVDWIERLTGIRAVFVDFPRNAGCFSHFAIGGTAFVACFKFFYSKLTVWMEFEKILLISCETQATWFVSHLQLYRFITFSSLIIKFSRLLSGRGQEYHFAVDSGLDTTLPDCSISQGTFQRLESRWVLIELKCDEFSQFMAGNFRLRRVWEKSSEPIVFPPKVKQFDYFPLCAGSFHRQWQVSANCSVTAVLTTGRVFDPL